MNRIAGPARSTLRAAALGVAVLSPVASHAALAMRQGYGVALVLAGLQAVAAGVIAFGALPRRLRALAPAGTALLLLGLLLGVAAGPVAALRAAAGLSHALIYLALLAVFAPTLAPGRESLVTVLARRLNPGFHAGMVPYTRKVTAAWCLFFLAQLVTSAVLLAVAPGAWTAFVTTVHAPCVLLMGLGEYAVRAWRWRHEQHTGLRDTVAGVRRLMAERRAAAGRTSP